MKIIAAAKPIDENKTSLTIVPLFESEQNAAVKEAAGDFKGTLSETYLLRRTLLLGLGKRKDYRPGHLRTALAAAAPVMQKLKITSLSVAVSPALGAGRKAAVNVPAMVEGILLSNYQFTQYKNFEPGQQPVMLEEIRLVFPGLRSPAAMQRLIDRAQTVAEAVIFARDLGNHPGNVATPTHLAEHALALGKADKGIKVKILGRKEIAAEKMGAVLAVSQGSDQEPKFIIMEYWGKKGKPPVVIVGKGITFDSGGISIKPGEKMEEMKFDMVGAAAVMGTVRAAAALKLPINLVGIIPAAENLPSGKATKPGDIVRTRSGKTIEVINTDAEGRMVLADGLDYARQYKPALVIDLATLTGSVVVALGDRITGAFSNRPAVLKQLSAAAAITGEKIWPMPLEESYEQLMKSDVADLRNQSPFRYGDAIHAANFLKNFVDYPWVHLDIAGTGWATRDPLGPRGATGVGVRLLIEFLTTSKTR